MGLLVSLPVGVRYVAEFSRRPTGPGSPLAAGITRPLAWPAEHDDRQGSTVPTYSPKAGDVTRQWYVIDATDVVLGRLAVQAANLLRGKTKPTYAPNVDGGDFVIIINADKIAIAGNKADRKFIHTHSGFPGGLKTRSVRQLMETRPERVVERAIKGMIPKNKLGNQIARKLKVYAGPSHPHAAQQPVPFEIKQVAQ